MTKDFKYFVSSLVKVLEKELSYVNIDDFYYKPKETYKMYCRLLKNASDFCNSQSKSSLRNVTVGKLEMCLFSIAANDEKNPISNIYKEEKRFITDEMDRHLKIERFQYSF